MKNACVTIEFDTEKMGALRIYLEQKQTTIEDELSKELETLYEKNVPSGVKNYIEIKEALNSKEKKTKTSKKAKATLDSYDETNST